MSRKGFTLIELLVVISIIALLSSVVLASLNAARDKGRIGSGKYFAAQVDHVAGDSLVAAWEFDECSGSNPKDSSGYGNTMSFTGSPIFSPDTPTGTGCSMDLAVGQGVYAADKEALDIGLGSVTRAFWFKTTSAGNSIWRKSDSSNTSGMNISMAVGGKVQCDIHYLPQVSVPTNSGGYNNGLWHHFVCVLDRTANIASVYMDGTFQGKADASSVSGINLDAGSQVLVPSGYVDMAMKIDSVHMFSKALTASEVGRLYAESGQSHRYAKE